MNLYVYILAMALTTYLIRVLPLTIFRKPIRSRFLRSFLYYVPYVCDRHDLPGHPVQHGLGHQRGGGSGSGDFPCLPGQ